MKNLLCLSTLIFLFVISCAPPEEKPLTDEQKKTLSSEVAERLDEIKAASNAMDLEAVKAIYWDDADFLAVSMDTTLDFDGYMKDTEEIWSGMSSISFEEEELEISVFDAETAYAIFGGYAEGETKEGQKMRIDDFFASLLFRKVEGSWMVASTHESGTFSMMEEETEEEEGSDDDE